MGQRVRIALILVLSFLLIFLLRERSVGPDNALFYPLKRYQEKNFLKLKSNPPEKANYYLTLLDNRLEELQNMVNNKKYGFVLPASSRFFTTAGELTDYINQNNLDDYRNLVKEKFASDSIILTSLVNTYPKDQNEEWKYIVDSDNYLILYTDKLQATP